MTIKQNALRYWDNGLRGAYQYRTGLLLKKREALPAAGFTEAERTFMLMRGWGGEGGDPDLPDERAAAMAAILVDGDEGFILFQAQVLTNC